MNPATVEADDTVYSGRLAKAMRAIRTKNSLSVVETIQRMGKAGYPISEAAYRHWENGTRVQHVDAIPALAKALKVTIHELLPQK